MNHLLLCNNKEKEGKKYVLHEWIRRVAAADAGSSAGQEQGISKTFFLLFEFVKHAKNDDM